MLTSLFARVQLLKQNFLLHNANTSPIVYRYCVLQMEEQRKLWDLATAAFLMSHCSV